MRISFVVLFILLVAVQSIAEAPEPNLSGTIDIEQDDPNKGSYTATQDKTVRYFDDLVVKYAQVNGGASIKIDELDDSEVHHLSGVYLYCSMTYGACPFILQTLLETDLINSYGGGPVACTNTKKFLTHYAKNDMHKRLSYLIPTALMAKKTNFEIAELPKYIKCQSTLEELLSKLKGNEAGFKERYKEDSEANLALKRTNLILSKVKTKVGNVFKAISAH
jgi:hypothetical protein